MRQSRSPTRQRRTRDELASLLEVRSLVSQYSSQAELKTHFESSATSIFNDITSAAASGFVEATSIGSGVFEDVTCHRD